MGSYRTYSSDYAAKRAILNAGLHGLRARLDRVGPAIKPVLLCELTQDVREVNRRGFAAELLNADDGA